MSTRFTHLALLPLHTLVRDPDANLAHLKFRLGKLTAQHPDLVVLPECTLTGYLYEEEDLRRFGEAVPGPATEQLGRLAAEYATWLCAGLIESDGGRFFDTAILFDRSGHIVHAHRKVNEKPPFSCGETFHTVETELGRLAIAVCGDLFAEGLPAQLEQPIDLLLVPMARSFDGRSPDAARWEREERAIYLDRVRALAVQAALVNALEVGTEEAAFGGGLVVSADGRLLGEVLHGTEGSLVYDLRLKRRL